MKIKYHGGTSFIFKGAKQTIGLDLSEGTKVDINLHSTVGKGENLSEVKLINWPGEYEVSGLPIIGLAVSGKDRIMYRFSLDALNVAILTGVGDKLSDEVLEKLGDINILLMPIRGGEGELNAKMAHSIYEDIEPQVVIPFDYDQSHLNEFAKEFGIMPEALEEYEISKSALSLDKSECVILSAA